MSTEENKSIVRRYQEIYNSNALDRLTEVVSEDLLTPNILPGIRTWFGGREGRSSNDAGWFSGLSDNH